ncbi:MAG: radical SAM protein [Candidatus Bathyarchaeia archaeon]
MGLTLQKAARIARYSVIPNKPYHVQWMITRKCNYRCRGCNVWREQDEKELSTEDVKKGLDILKELGVVEIVFSGGNPLLREDIGEILDYASRFFITTVYDNGSVAAEKIDALRSVDFVAISLDSLDSRKNDYVKGVKGSWKKAMQTIEKLHENGIRVGVSPTISQFNLYEMVDFTNYFLEKGIPVWYCLYSYDSSNDLGQLFKIGRKNDEFLITDNKAMVELCDALMDMERKNSNVLITTKTLKAVKNLYWNGNRTWKCRALQNFFIIDHIGRVAGCHLNKPVASIFDLPKVWNSEEFNVLRNIYSECSRCIYLCYIVYSIHGSVVGNLEIAREKWRSAKLFLRKKSLKSLSLVKWK